MASGNFTVLGDDQKALIKTIDKSAKNKWNFKWLEDEVKVKDLTVKLGDTIEKINVSGKASCKLCHSVINYGGRGKSTLRDHICSDMHYNKLKLQKTNYSLGSFPEKKDKLFPMFSNITQVKSGSSTSNPIVSSNIASGQSPLPTVPLSDRVATMEAMILSVMAEHSMPLTFAPILVDLAKACSRDPKALAQVQLSPRSAGYKLKYGLARTIQNSLFEDLKSTPFSLNIDEATSSNNKKVLSILVSYVKGSGVRIHHLASIELLKTNSCTIYDAICQVFDDNSIPWTNLVSILFDSCAVMRGNLSGVETKIRQQKAPHLLNIDGDSCHHMNNVAKKFCSPFEGYLEHLFNDLFHDFKWCSDQKSLLNDICSILKIPYTVPQMSSSTRWLSCYDRSIETQRMWDSLRTVYFAFLSKKDKDLYFPEVKKMLVAHGLNLAEQKRIFDIIESLSMKKMTKDGLERKGRINSKLFFKSNATELQLEFYSSVLAIMKEYISVFQTKVPMVHKLHDAQMAAVKKLYHCFIRPEKMVSITKLDVSDSSVHLPLRHIFIGYPKKSVDKSFLEKCVEAYVQAALQMKKTLIHNNTLESLSAIDPSFRNHTIVKTHLEKLSQMCEHLSGPDKLNKIKDEIRAYTNDRTLPPFSENDRLDKWWTSDEINKSYPLLSELAKALVSIFHGAQVESTFSVMSRIVTKQTASLSVGMLNAIQTIKYELMAASLTSIEYFKRNQPSTDPVCHQLCKNMRGAWKADFKKREVQETLNSMKQKLSQHATTASAAKRISILAKKRQISKHAEKAKAGLEPPSKRRKL